MNVSNHAKGIMFASSGILVISPDSLLIRFVNIDLWTLMFLRGLFIALALLALILILNSTARLKQHFLALDRYAWGMISLMAMSSFTFVASIQTTSVAHTLIIVGAAPIFSAFLGLLVFHEKLRANIWLTIGIVFTGLIFVVYDQQKSTLLGDFYAFITGLSWAFILILAKRTQAKNMFMNMMISGVIIMLISLPISSLDTITSTQFLIGALLGTLNGIALSLLTFAPRYMMAAEVAVFMPLESVFGSLLVWWFMAEYPGDISLLAGLIIILTLMVNSVYQIRNSNS